MVRNKWLVIVLAMMMVFGLMVGMAVAYNNDNGLVAHWPFNEGEGGTVEDVVGDNDGVIEGAEWTKKDEGASVLCNKYALEFEDDDDRVVVPHSDDLQLLDGGTIALWVNIQKDTDDWPRLVSKSGETGTGSGWVFLLDGNNKPRLAMDDVAETTDTSISIEDEWVHLAVTFDGSEWNFYIDGEKDSSVSRETLPPEDETDLNIGNEPTDERVFTGMIDNVRIYNDVLGADEIKEIYDGFADIDVEWLPPISLEDFTLNENATLPIKLAVECCPIEKVSLEVGEKGIDLKYDEEEGHFIGLFRPDEAGEYEATVFCDDVELDSIEFEVRETAPNGRGQGRR